MVSSCTRVAMQVCHSFVGSFGTIRENPKGPVGHVTSRRFHHHFHVGQFNFEIGLILKNDEEREQCAIARVVDREAAKK